jgi:hypothetical protein
MLNKGCQIISSEVFKDFIETFNLLQVGTNFCENTVLHDICIVLSK